MPHHRASALEPTSVLPSDGLFKAMNCAVGFWGGFWDRISGRILGSGFWGRVFGIAKGSGWFPNSEPFVKTSAISTED